MLKNEVAKRDYLEEHLRYELLMLRHTYFQITSYNNQLDWNAFFVSFVAHARNLFDFLRNTGRDKRFVADDFTGGSWRLSKSAISKIRRVIGTVHAEVLHLGKRTRAPALKAGIDAATELFNWIEEHWTGFER